jgi:hypothetical protein
MYRGPVNFEPTVPRYGSPIMNKFWKWFNKNNKPYLFLNQIDDGLEKKRLLDQLLQKLHEYNERLFFIIGGSPDDVQELIITAQGNRAHFGAVEQLVRVAPPFQHWNVIALKPSRADDFESEFQGIRLKVKDLWFLPLRNQHDPALLGIRIGIPGYELLREERWLPTAVSQVVETITGEKSYAYDIDFIDLIELPADPEEDGMYALIELPQYIQWRKGKAK